MKCFIGNSIESKLIARTISSRKVCVCGEEKVSLIQWLSAFQPAFRFAICRSASAPVRHEPPARLPPTAVRGRLTQPQLLGDSALGRVPTAVETCQHHSHPRHCSQWRHSQTTPWWRHPWSRHDDVRRQWWTFLVVKIISVPIRHQFWFKWIAFQFSWIHKRHWQPIENDLKQKQFNSKISEAN